MFLKKIPFFAILSAIAATCLCLILTPVSTFAETPVSWPSPSKNPVSESVVLMDADTGAVLYEKNAYERAYPASTTKILTGLLVCKNAALTETVTCSKAAANSVTSEDSSLGSVEGEEYSVEEALYGLLLYSANELAYALAEHVSGSLDNFVALMNQTAKEAGALNTHFANASGLYAEDHYTTAYDMALIAKMCFNNPAFLAIDSQTTHTIPPTNKHSSERIFSNRNLLLPGRTYGYDYCIGGKTGYIGEGGYTLVTYAKKDNARLICVTFRSTADDRFKDSKDLYQWGFDSFNKVALTGSNLTSHFSSTGLMSSDRFNTGKMSEDFTGTYVTLPTGGSLSDVTISNDPRYSASADDLQVNIPIAFMYSDHIAGSANILFSSLADTSDANSLVPTKTYTAHVSAESQPVALSVNIWIIVAVFIAIIVLITIKKQRRIKADASKYKRIRKRRR